MTNEVFEIKLQFAVEDILGRKIKPQERRRFQEIVTQFVDEKFLEINEMLKKYVNTERLDA